MTEAILDATGAPKTAKGPETRTFYSIAGAGFEPATFGL